MNARITTRLLSTLRPPTAGRLYVWDTDLRGFGVIVRLSGVRTFVVHYGGEQHRRQVKIGDFGAFAVDQARGRARELLSVIAQGGDPLIEKERRRAMPTFGEFKAEYIEEVTHRKKEPQRDRFMLGKCPGTWTRTPLDQITAEMIQRAFDDIAKDAPVGCNRWKASVSAMLQSAWRRGLIPENVARKVRKRPEGAPRTRVLSDAEMTRLLAVVDTLGAHDRALLRLLIETGARVSEALHMQWSDLDLDGGIWRLPKTKAGRPQAQPLPSTLVELLRVLPRKSLFVIPGKHEGKPRTHPRVLWARVCERARLEGVHIHDLRRSAGLFWARTLGLHVATKMLRHSNVSVTQAHYAPLGIEALKEAAEARSTVLKFKRA